MFYAMALDTELLFLCTVDILNTSDVEEGAADPTHWVNLGIKVRVVSVNFQTFKELVP